MTNPADQLEARALELVEALNAATAPEERIELHAELVALRQRLAEIRAEVTCA